MNATVQPTGWLQVQEDLLSRDVTVRNLEKSTKERVLKDRSRGHRAGLSHVVQSTDSAAARASLGRRFQLNTRPSRKRRNPTAGADALQATESAPFRTWTSTAAAVTSSNTMTVARSNSQWAQVSQGIVCAESRSYFPTHGLLWKEN